MSIDPKPGDQVVFANPTSGDVDDQQKCHHYLELGRGYTIAAVEKFGYATYVILKECSRSPRVYFNAVNFESGPIPDLPGIPESIPACLSNLNDYAAEVHRANAKWWIDIHTGKRIERNFGEMIALCHSELSEALEGHRKGLMDDKLPHRKMAEVELADCLIRILDIAGGLGMDIEGAFQEKMAYNAKRADHTVEGRRLPGGKAY